MRGELVSQTYHQVYFGACVSYSQSIMTIPPSYTIATKVAWDLQLKYEVPLRNVGTTEGANKFTGIFAVACIVLQNESLCKEIHNLNLIECILGSY